MGEFELLARVRERLPEAGGRVRLGMGDDAAVTVPGGATATSIDAVVDGVHFLRELASLTQIGRKALAAALSDLAAMGAEPGEAYVAIGVPDDLDEDGCIELLDGVLEVAAATGTTLAGGDVTRAPKLSVTIAAVGHAERPELFVTRGGARPGDLLVLTGELGGAAAGLEVLRRPEAAQAVSPEIAAPLRARQLEPQARLDAGRALAASGATSMIDLSDGLGGDAGHVSAASEVGLAIDGDALPIAPGVVEVAAAVGGDELELAVSGGEDYELLATLPPARLATAARAVEKSGARLTRIGEVVPGRGVEIRRLGGEPMAARGFDQLS